MLKGFAFDYDEKSGIVKLVRSVDLTYFLISNKNERLRSGKGFSKGKTLRKIGSIPIDILIKHGIDIHDDNAIRKFLKEHPEFRTSEGGI